MPKDELKKRLLEEFENTNDVFWYEVLSRTCFGDLCPGDVNKEPLKVLLASAIDQSYFQGVADERARVEEIINQLKEYTKLQKCVQRKQFIKGIYTAVDCIIDNLPILENLKSN